MREFLSKQPNALVSKLICVIILLCFALIIALPRYKMGIDVGDEGFLAYGAERVLAGQLPNRDFVSLQPPFSFYTTALFFKIFGISLGSLRILGLSIYLLIITMVYMVSLRFVRPILALTAGVLAAVMSMSFFNFTPFAALHGILASLVTLLLVLKFTETSRRRWAFLAGITTALIVLSRHDQGFYFIIAVLIYALLIKFYHKDIRPGKMLGFWISGILAVMIPLLTYWLVCGALPYMFRQLVIFPLYNYSRTSSLPFPVFKLNIALNKNMLTGLFYFLPIIEFLVAIWLIKKIVRRQFYADHTHIAFILIISILFYCQVLTRSDYHHLFIILPPFFILLVLSIEAFIKMFSKKWISAVVTFTILSLIASFILYTKPVYLPSLTEKTTEISLDRAHGISAYKAEIAKRVEMVTRTIQKYSRPGDSILCLPYQPIFYFLSQRHNPTRWNYIWPGDQTADDYKQLIKQADESRTAIVVLYRKDEINKYAPEIIEYVNKKYKVAEEFDFVSIYVPLKH
jgi:hypothetical protein